MSTSSSGGSDGDSSVPPADSTSRSRSKTPSSERRVAANRSNAKKSTGPKTEAGKERSSRNSQKHHIFVSRIEPIEDGSYAEDPEEFYEHVGALVAAMRPRDVVEHELATRVSGVLVKLERLDRWSALASAHAAVMNSGDFELGVRSEPRVEALMDLANRLVALLRDGPSADKSGYEDFARFIRRYGPDPEVGVRGLWNKNHTPTTEADWRKAFDSLRDHHWPVESAALAWAEDTHLKLTRKLEAVEDLEARLVASRILKGPFDLQLKYESRLVNDLKRYLTIYERLQMRDMPL